MLLSKHRRFVSCEKNPECKEPALPSMVELYEIQVLNVASDI